MRINSFTTKKKNYQNYMTMYVNSQWYSINPITNYIKKMMKLKGIKIQLRCNHDE